MTMTERDDLLRWAEAWRTETPEATAREAERVVARVRFRTRLRGLLFAGEILVAAGALGVLAHLGWVSEHSADRPLALLLSGAVLAALAYGVWNARGTWTPESTSVRGFIELEVLRLGRGLAAVRGGWVLLAAFVAAYIPWITARVADAAARWRMFGFLALVVAAEVVVLLVVGRWTQGALERWRKLAAEWSTQNPRP